MTPVCKWSVTHTVCAPVFIGTLGNATQMIFCKNRKKTLNTCLLFEVGGLSGYYDGGGDSCFCQKKVVDGAKTLLPSLKKSITLESNHFLFMMTKNILVMIIIKTFRIVIWNDGADLSQRATRGRQTFLLSAASPFTSPAGMKPVSSGFQTGRPTSAQKGGN